MSEKINDEAQTDFYINEIRALNAQTPKTAIINTYGCQMNVHDSEKLQALLVSMGYEIVSGADTADIIIFNTCCVRENAENKLYGNLGMLKGSKGSGAKPIVVVCGCMMQQEASVEKIKQSYRNVDIIFGTFNLHHFPRLLYDRLKTGKPVIDVWRESEKNFAELSCVNTDSVKAYVSIMYGCDNYCSYCIVPYVRGAERSRSCAEILNEIENLAKSGIKEITLLGQNVNSYGKNLEGGISFAKLLYKINEIEGIKRIRFMTSHPRDLSGELISAMAECEKVCAHLHLPFQSGSSKILKLMNRKYTREDYLSLIDKIKSKIPDISITTDIIVGFPGEDEADFADTLDVVEKVRFAMAYTFIYSKRLHTPAAQMPQTATDEEIKARFEKLVEKVNTIAAEINKNLEGKTLEVLFESFNGETGVATGRTSGNSIVHVKTDDFESGADLTGNTAAAQSGARLIGKTAAVLITGSKTFYLNGKIENGAKL
ncbi:MAG: tRNA (N6-isopentenyl adenosine(37)-C2)-methylthiotransferase MiaB [Clostridiales bacterium]|jgi:tRNA-2-methylthio-N6-dimethylallyladenosine synthase|nr:tRNA (N6-isopentenyl adenosine(37)-C2)-methylthiotransferase MiaB [Clostridiales bacterium]